MTNNKNIKTADEVKNTDIYIVETPVKNYNGIVAGVQFAYGKAEVRSGWILNWFKENGYIVNKKIINWYYSLKINTRILFHYFTYVILT